MRETHSPLATRWAGALLAPMALLAGLGLAAYLFSHSQDVNPFVNRGLQEPIMVHFALKAALTEILPLYVGLSLLLFLFSMVIARLPWFCQGAWSAWRFSHAFWSSLGLMLLVHAILWWRVPTAMWVIPGLNRLPMGLALLLI